MLAADIGTHPAGKDPVVPGSSRDGAAAVFGLSRLVIDNHDGQTEVSVVGRIGRSLLRGPGAGDDLMAGGLLAAAGSSRTRCRSEAENAVLFRVCRDHSEESSCPRTEHRSTGHSCSCRRAGSVRGRGSSFGDRQILRAGRLDIADLGGADKAHLLVEIQTGRGVIDRAVDAAAAVSWEILARKPASSRFLVLRSPSARKEP